jgi:GNAT superfamily N-acetyltransferase
MPYSIWYSKSHTPLPDSTAITGTAAMICGSRGGHHRVPAAGHQHPRPLHNRIRAPTAASSRQSPLVRCKYACKTVVGKLLAICVDPEHWDSGVGRLLVVAAREQLRRDGFTEAALWVLDGNARARRFYERDGWAPDGARQTKTVAGVALDEVRYRRTL